MSSAETVERPDTMPKCVCRMRQPKKQNKIGIRKKVNVVHPKNTWSRSEDESGEELEVMHIDNAEKGANKLFILKGTFKRKPFHAVIDTGSPVAIFTMPIFKRCSERIINFDHSKRTRSISISAATNSVFSEPSMGKSSRERKS